MSKSEELKMACSRFKAEMEKRAEIEKKLTRLNEEYQRNRNQVSRVSKNHYAY